MINPTKKYTYKADYKCYLPNYYRETLFSKIEEIKNEGWQFTEICKKAEETIIRIT